jgi:hypothetical protein
MVNLVHNAWNDHYEKPPKWFEKWNGKFSTMHENILGKKFLKPPLAPTT